MLLTVMEDGDVLSLFLLQTREQSYESDDVQLQTYEVLEPHAIR